MTQDLLELAELILAANTSRPRQAFLRRAVSTAYYAAFHAYCEMCARALVGNRHWDYYTPIYRSVEHRTFKKLATRKDVPASAKTFLLLLVALQEERHEADYTPNQLWLTKGSALDAVRRARDISDGLNALSEDERLRLAVLTVSKER